MSVDFVCTNYLFAYHACVDADIGTEKAEFAFVDEIVLFGTFGAFDCLALILGVVGGVLEGPDVARAEGLEHVLARRLEFQAPARVWEIRKEALQHESLDLCERAEAVAVRVSLYHARFALFLALGRLRGKRLEHRYEVLEVFRGRFANRKAECGGLSLGLERGFALEPLLELRLQFLRRFGWARVLVGGCPLADRAAASLQRGPLFRRFGLRSLLSARALGSALARCRTFGRGRLCHRVPEELFFLPDSSFLVHV